MTDSVFLKIVKVDADAIGVGSTFFSFDSSTRFFLLLRCIFYVSSRFREMYEHSDAGAFITEKKKRKANDPVARNSIFFFF
jgi:hypothetical protein